MWNWLCRLIQWSSLSLQPTFHSAEEHLVKKRRFLARVNCDEPWWLTKLCFSCHLFNKGRFGTLILFRTIHLQSARTDYGWTGSLTSKSRQVWRLLSPSSCLLVGNLQCQLPFSNCIWACFPPTLPHCVAWCQYSCSLIDAGCAKMEKHRIESRWKI